MWYLLWSEVMESHIGAFQLLHAESFICCTLAVQYNLYSMVGWSIACMYDLGGMFTSVFHIFIGCGPLYCTVYYLQITMTKYHSKQFAWRQQLKPFSFSCLLLFLVVGKHSFTDCSRQQPFECCANPPSEWWVCFSCGVSQSESHSGIVFTECS